MTFVLIYIFVYQHFYILIFSCYNLVLIFCIALFIKKFNNNNIINHKFDLQTQKVLLIFMKRNRVIPVFVLLRALLIFREISFAKHLQLQLIRRSSYSLGTNCPSLQSFGQRKRTPNFSRLLIPLFGETFVSA